MSRCGPNPAAEIPAVSGPAPAFGELLIWIDDVHGLEVDGRAQGKANFAHLLARDWAAAEAFARQWRFPEHHLVVRPEREDDPRIHKGISSWAELEALFTWALEQSPSGVVFLETDVRAHANPTRQENIRLAAEDLARKLRSLVRNAVLRASGSSSASPGCLVRTAAHPRGNHRPTYWAV